MATYITCDQCGQTVMVSGARRHISITTAPPGFSALAVLLHVTNNNPDADDPDLCDRCLARAVLKALSLLAPAEVSA